MIRPLAALLLVFASGTASVLARLAEPSAPSAPDLQALIDGAAARGESRVVFPPGEHRLASALQLRNLSNLVIDGNSARLVFTSLKDGGIAISDTNALVLRGLTIDFDPLPFTQGVIEAIDTAAGTLTWAVHDGYPDLSPVYLSHRAHAFDATTREWKRDAPDIYASSARALTPRRGQLSFSPDRRWQLETLAAGDCLVQDVRRERGIRIDRSRDITLEHITIHSAPGLAMTLRFMDGQNRFSHLTITPGPLPARATEPRLLSTSADGFNYAYARTGPVLEHCDFSRMGDDSVNLHGIAFVVAEADPATRTINLIRPYGPEGFPSVVRPGDEVHALAQGNFDFTGTARVVRFDIDPAPDAHFRALAERMFPHVGAIRKFTVYRLTHDAPLSLATGDFVEIPAIAAPGYTIRQNRFSQHRGRALRLMSPRGLVEDNVIDGIKQAAITLGPEFVGFREAGWVCDVTVRRNTIKNSAFDPVLLRGAAWTPGALSVIWRGETPDAPRPVAARHRSLRIEQNTIKNVGGPAIHINQAENVLIKNNRVTRANQAPAVGAKNKNPWGLATADPIEVDHSENVTIETD
ncbi:MAG: right-handed parallel beta-helix repeat-containing protein [Opitutaceae bacterium]|jgi:hypothetical protein|nr:right-handed parallel beta-helix repeat-containing protein [Opitutaceae bacterium]